MIRNNERPSAVHYSDRCCYCCRVSPTPARPCPRSHCIRVYARASLVQEYYSNTPFHEGCGKWPPFELINLFFCGGGKGQVRTSERTPTSTIPPFYRGAPSLAGATLCPCASWHPLNSALFIPADPIVFCSACWLHRLLRVACGRLRWSCLCRACLCRVGLMGGSSLVCSGSAVAFW